MKKLFLYKNCFSLILFLFLFLYLTNTLKAQPTVNIKMANDLAKKNGCVACHHANRKLVGPAFHDIAKRYSGDEKFEPMLMNSVKLGVKGKFGFVPMPPHPRLAESDNRILIRWILQGAPEK